MAAAWSLHLQYQIHQLEKIQCNAARFVMNNYTRCRSVTNNLSWSTLKQRRNQIKLILFFKIVYGLVKGTTLTLTPLSTITCGRYMYYHVHRDKNVPITQIITYIIN